MTPLTARVAALATLIDDRWPNGAESRLVTELARTLPRSLTHMATLTADGYPTSTPGASDRGTGAGGDHDKLGTIVALRAHATEAYSDLCGRVSDAAAHLALEDRLGVRSSLKAAQWLVDTWQPPVVVQPSLHRCTAPDSESLEPWVRPECDALAVKAGMCSACYTRRRRFKADQAQEVA